MQSKKRESLSIWYDSRFILQQIAILQDLLQKNEIKTALFDFRNALGINNFSKDLSETEFHLIALVAEAQDNNYNIKLTEISEKLNVTRSAITQVTNKLVEKQYIEKYTLPTNKKEVYLKIGQKAIEQAVQKIKEGNCGLWLKIY